MLQRKGHGVNDLSPMTDQIHSMRTIRVSQGLFVLRYVASKAGLNAPSLSVEARPGSGVNLISPNDELPARLISPGDGMVVRATSDAFINVTVTPSHRNGSCDAELVLERVSTTLRPVSGQAPAVVAAPPRSAGEIDILAHVARRGDVLAKGGAWICGPDLPMAIEGIEIRWPNRPDGVELVGRATINARGVLRSLPEQSAGTFLGTRGKAAPIAGLSLMLKGPAAGDYTLRCEALFLGQPVQSVSGTACTVGGPTGLEPLVGLRLSIRSAEERVADRTIDVLRQQALPQAAPMPAPVPAQAEKPSRVRIFRSSRARAVPALGLPK